MFVGDTKNGGQQHLPTAQWPHAIMMMWPAQHGTSLPPEGRGLGPRGPFCRRFRRTMNIFQRPAVNIQSLQNTEQEAIEWKTVEEAWGQSFTRI
jgi:hypothetical protein